MIQVLVLCDDVWHPGEVIERGLEDLQDGKFHFDFVRDAKDILTKDMIEKYPVIMNCKSDNLHSGNEAPWFEEGVTEVGVKELEEYVGMGGGFLSVHSGNCYNEEYCPAYAAFVGNCFVTHPPRCQVEVKVTGIHPVTDGVTDFVIRDEHYELTNLASDAKVILESVSETGGKQVAGYVRTLEKGRICVLTPGHILSVWKHPMFRRLLENAIDWCAGQGKESGFDYVEAYPWKETVDERTFFMGFVNMYQNLGFKICGETEDKFVMRKALKGNGDGNGWNSGSDGKYC